MKSWLKVKIYDLCNLAYGKTLPAKQFTPDGFPVYGANGIIGCFSKYTHFDPQVLVSCRGENSGTVNLSPQKCFITNNSIICNLKTDTDKKFLFYALKATPREAMVSGSAQPQVVIKDLENITLFIPNQKSEQAQIAAILSTVDKAIEQTEALVAKYRRIKTGLMQDLLTKGIDEQGSIRSEDTHVFFDSKLGRIPEGWFVGKFGDMATLQRGFDITSKNLREGKVPVVSSSGITAFHDTAMAEGPGVITGRKGTLGRVYYVEGPYWPHDTTLWVNDFHDNNPKFIYRYLSQMNLDKMDASTANPTLNRNFVHPIWVAFPKPDEQKRIVEVLDSFDKTLISEGNWLNKLRYLKTGLMQDLLTGKVRVTEKMMPGTTLEEEIKK